MKTKKYTRLDTVEATPMTFGEFSKNSYMGDMEGVFPDDTDGYLVKREGEIDEWRTSGDFERQFVETDDYIGRMKFELKELQNRLYKLRAYLEDHNDDMLLRMQSQAMTSYRYYLTERIRQAEGK